MSMTTINELHVQQSQTSLIELQNVFSFQKIKVTIINIIFFFFEHCLYF